MLGLDPASPAGRVYLTSQRQDLYFLLGTSPQHPLIHRMHPGLYRDRGKRPPGLLVPLHVPVILGEGVRVSKTCEPASPLMTNKDKALRPVMLVNKLDISPRETCFWVHGAEKTKL